ncbi:hypothetical protein D3C78_1566530 [compost metagenome]
MAQVAITLQVSVQTFAGPVGTGFGVELGQPFANPALGQEPAVFTGAAGNLESHAGAHVFLVRGEVRGAVERRQDATVEGQGQAMAVAVDIGARQFDQTHARPVARALVEAVRRHEAEERNR